MKRKLTKRIASFFMILAFVLSYITIVRAEPSYDYPDIKNYYPYNSWAVETGKKYSLIFLENNTREAKRWEIASILYNIADIDRQIKQANFNDLFNVSDYIAERINVIANNKIVQGYNDGTFKPYNNVTRAEFVVMLDRANLINNFNSEKQSYSFIDITNHWASNSIIKVVNSEIMSGKGDNKFCPEDNITPQEILIILDRLVTQGTITSEKLVNTMIDTFKCKKYGEEEKYIVEVIYSKFDQVQNDVQFYWQLNDLYNPNEWQGIATYKDLAYVIYYNWYYGVNYSDTVDKEKSRMEYIRKIVLNAQDIFDVTEENLNKEIKMSDLIKSIAYRRNTNYDTIVCADEKMILFTNFNSLETKERAALFDTSADIFAYNNPNKIYNVIENSNNIFPINAPVTRYMLNYYITRIAYLTLPQYTMGIKSICNFLGIENAEIETDISKMPYNYYDYPFIVKGVPKEYYEKPFENTYNKYVYKPKECFVRHGREYYHICNDIAEFYKTLLNVDYNTIDEDAFIKNITQYVAYPGKDTAKIREYIKYVKDNKIILKGEASIIPASTSIKEIFLPGEGGIPYVRMCLRFEIISSSTNQNILLGDNLNNASVTYNSNSYMLCFDKALMGTLSGDYRIQLIPLVREINYLNNNINEL